MQTHNLPWKIKVAPKPYNEPPFPGICSRLATATIMQFYGESPVVCHMLQRLSHKSRSFIITQDGLKGFIVPLELVSFYLRAVKSDHLLLMNHIVDTNALYKALKVAKNKTQIRKLLQQQYPGLYLAALGQLERYAECEEFMAQCKNLKSGNCEDYTIYVHGFLLPTVLRFFEKTDDQALKQKLAKNWNSQNDQTCELEISDGYGGTLRFKGQKDMAGRANGFGKAVATDGTIYAGTFFGYLFEGVGKYLSMLKLLSVGVRQYGCEVWAGEWLRGQMHGKVTYTNEMDGTIFNMLWRHGEMISCSYDMAGKEQDVFYEGLKAKKALDKDWKKYAGLSLRL